MSHFKKTTVQQRNNRNMTERKSNASAIAKTTLMNFLIKTWRKFRGIFKKRHPSTEKIISEVKAVLEHPLSTNEIFIQIDETNNEKEKASLITLIAKQKTAKSIIELVEQGEQTITANKKGKKQLYELFELRAELQLLEEKRVILDYAESKIIVAHYPDTSSIDRQFDFLSNLLNKNNHDDKIELSKISISAFDKSFQQLEKLLFDKSTLRRHTTRENIKQKQEEIYKNQIKQKLLTLENFINQNNLVDAKLLINLLSNSIKSNMKNELARLTKSKEKYKEKELYNLKKQEEELLKKQFEQAKELKEQEEKKLAELKLKRDQEAIQKKAEEEKLNAKANRLKALLNKRSNWRDFQRVLQENGITTFYHFTDFQNLKSIREQNGLYSWHYADSNGIVINFPGGDALSRDLDKRYGLQDFVRVSFCTDHPMQYRLEQRGRNLALLKVDIEVAYYENTIFCNINATDSSHKRGNHLEDLEKIRFSATKRNYVSREDPDFKHHQAEVLIKTWIPLEHITNIKAFA